MVRSISTNRTSSPEVDAQLRQSLGSIATNSEGEVVLLVGGVGAGKSTFTRRYFNFLIDRRIKEQVLPLYLDFTKLGEETEDLAGLVDREVIRQLEEDYPAFRLTEWQTLQKVFEKDIERLRSGVLEPYFKGDPLKFQQMISDHIRGEMKSTERYMSLLVDHLRFVHKRTICIVFDNVDQLGQDFQHRVLKLAFQKVRTWHLIGMLSIREETFWRFRNSPPFDAYRRYVYHISAPRVANVLSKRLELARREHGHESITLESRSGLHISNIPLGDFLGIIVHSFLGKNKANITFLNRLLETIYVMPLRCSPHFFSPATLTPMST